jgi:hypothetical protein
MKVENLPRICCTVYHKEEENIDKHINGRHILCTVENRYLEEVRETAVEIEGAETMRGRIKKD